MTTGLSAALANEILNALGNGTAPSILPVSTFWVQLHTGDPGGAGTANVAGNEVRKSASFAAAAGGGMSNDVVVAWTAGEVDTSEDYTFWSGWTASTAGTFLVSGEATGNMVTVGDRAEIPVGSLDLTFTIAA